MISSCKVIRRSAVNFDAENKVIIDTDHILTPKPDEAYEVEPEDKEQQARNSAARIIKQAEQQAERILSEARRAASDDRDTIISAANAEADRITAEARARGYDEGISSATSEGNKIKAEARKVLQDANAERKAMEENLEPEMVSLIIRITEKIISDTVSISPAVIINLIKQGLESASLTGDVVIYASPQDYEIVTERKNELLALADGSVRMEIKKDLSLNPMDCIIETPFGDIDCSLGQQLEAIKANLTYILNNK